MAVYACFNSLDKSTSLLGIQQSPVSFDSVIYIFSQIYQISSFVAYISFFKTGAADIFFAIA